ncbi:unnamed protein product [Blepharisma stoltei]|uniref:Alkyl transferase n=1 Tax=Blepharisma stoltei TaxID=1481888 RepID=A0AAU9J547_9CILI|nr:unnamed protein product [Blepharisma stoltei]
MVKYHEKLLLHLVKSGKIPNHIAFIMDGNRRWALNSGMNKIEGHQFGLEKLLEVLEWCMELEIRIITVFAFSTDNFNRSTEEVNELMRLFSLSCEKITEKSSVVMQKGIKVKVCGDLTGFPKEQKDALEKIQKETSHNSLCKLNICLGYGGMEEVAQAMEKVALKVSENAVKADDITREMIEQELYIPEPVDLMVRTGESRLSNFLLYQCCETTKFIMLTSIYWPSLKVWHLIWMIFKYQYIL